jgi:carboxymethylenebutenolidase
MKRVKGETLKLSQAEGILPVYEASAPGAAAEAAVIVVQEAFGVNDHIEDVARRFADEGYLAVAPHLFHDSGAPRLSYEAFDEAMAHLRALTVEGIERDLETTLGHLRDSGIDAARTAIVGFCMGGTVALFAGATHALGAAVSFYGGGVSEGRFGFPGLLELAPRLRSPWLGLYGDQDQGIPTEDVERLREAAARAPVATSVIRYPDAGHGFHCDARSAYHAASAADGWTRTLAWLREHGV